MKKLFLSALAAVYALGSIAQSVLIDAPVTTDTAFKVYNAGTGPVGSFITKNTDNTGALIYGDHYGKGGGLALGLYNLSNNSAGIAVTHNGTGNAAKFVIDNPASDASAISVLTNGTGYGIELTNTNAASSNANIYSVNLGSNGLFSFAANNGVYGFSTANTGGVGVWGQSTAGSNNGIGVKGISNSTVLTSGSVTGINNSSGIGVYGTATGPVGTGVWGIVTGAAAKGGYFESANYIGLTAVTISNDQYTSALVASNAGKGNGALFGAGTNGYAIYATSESANTAAGAALFETPNASNNIDAVQIRNAGLAGALNIKSTNNSNVVTMVRVTKSGTGDYIVFEDGVGANKVRFDNAGKGFFNGGTQNSGADIAEAFDVKDNIDAYEPGDVLSISVSKKRAVEKSSSPYSTLVAGVYATKPGVLLTEENIDNGLKDKVPMGVIGVIPTKVCTEGGTIKMGDLLVTSSIPGVAMKADPEKIRIGQCIGKALDDFNSNAVGKINVLVSIK